MHPGTLLPEIALLVGAISCLVGGSFTPRERQWRVRLLAVAALLVAGTAAAVGLAGDARTVYTGTFAVDTATGVARLVVVAATLLVIGLGVEEIAGSPRESETYALLLLSATGVCVLAGADDLLVLAVGFLLTSIPLYGLIGIARTPLAAEAVMKTYLLGALLGVTLLLGVSLLYGLAGTTRYGDLASSLAGVAPAAVAVGVVAVLAGLLFEAGAVPGHFWVPDAAQGSTTTAAAYLTTVTKIGAVVAIYRLVAALPGGDGAPDWLLLVAVLAVVSMTLGNLAAFGQDDARRLLGWSTVSQVGYLLVAVAVVGRTDMALGALLLYLVGYAVTNLAAFAVLAAVPQRRSLSDFRGFARVHPWLAGSLLVALLGLVGTPPTAVLVGKLTVASAAWDGGSAWLAVVLLANTVASLFYYLRWVRPVFAAPAEDVDGGISSAPALPWAAGAAIVAAAASVAVGVGAGAVLAVVDGPLVR